MNLKPRKAMAPRPLQKLVPPVNMDRTERWVSALAGIGLIALGLNNKRFRGLVLPTGGALLLRGVTGRCPVNQALGRNTAELEEPEFDSPVASVHRGEGIRVDRTVTVYRPAAELYQYWRNFENLPRIMRHVDSVTVLDHYRSHWVVDGPAGTHFEWDAEIHNEKENELIAWRSLDGDINHAGSVLFRPTPTGKGTEVRVELRYEPPAGALGAAIARLFGEEPTQQVAEDLMRFKQAMEAQRITSPESGPAF
jgi:uncharacterized membrane protein